MNTISGPPGPHSKRPRFHDIRHIESTDSTNADVLKLGKNGEPEGIVVIAAQQTAGRGRQGRVWVAAPGSALLMSVLLRPPHSVASLVTAALAVAARDAVAATTGAHVAIKWPNDLIVPSEQGTFDRKLAGILAEADWPAGSSAASGYRTPTRNARVLVAAGVGVNVHRLRDAPGCVVDRAVALDELVDDPPTVGELADATLEAFEGTYQMLLTDRDGLLDAWRAKCATIGERVRIDLGTDDVEGTAVQIDDEGRLVVETLEGETRVFAAGDVVHLRR